MKYNAESKLRMIHEYLEKKQTMLALSKKVWLHLSKIKYMIKLYEMYGKAPFDDRQASRIYSREEKLNAIKSVLSKQKSTR